MIFAIPTFSRTLLASEGIEQSAWRRVFISAMRQALCALLNHFTKAIRRVSVNAASPFRFSTASR